MKDDFKNTYPDKQEAGSSGDHDSLFGSLLFESFCGVALGELCAETVNTPQWARELNVSDAVDLYDEYRRDRTNGGFADNITLGVKKALNGMFNRLGSPFHSQPETAPGSFSPEGKGSYAFISAASPALS